MTETDIFHLGDGYHVYVNTAFYMESGGEYGRSLSYISWVGDAKDTPLIIKGIKLLAKGTCRVLKGEQFTEVHHKNARFHSKNALSKCIQLVKEQLKEIILEQELFNHLLDPTI